MTEIASFDVGRYTVERCGEEEYIQGRCTPGMAFAEWIRQVRAQTPGGNRVTIYNGIPGLDGGTP